MASKSRHHTSSSHSRTLGKSAVESHPHKGTQETERKLCVLTVPPLVPLASSVYAASIVEKETWPSARHRNATTRRDPRSGVGRGLLLVRLEERLEVETGRVRVGHDCRDQGSKGRLSAKFLEAGQE